MGRGVDLVVDCSGGEAVSGGGEGCGGWGGLEVSEVNVYQSEEGARTRSVVSHWLYGARSAIHVSTYTFSPTCPTRTSTRCVRVKSSAFAWGAIAFSVQETIFHIYLLHFDHVLTTCYPTSSCDLCQLIKIGTVGTPFLYSTHPSAVTSFECYKPLQS